jgi:hypothetical protein
MEGADRTWTMRYAAMVSELLSPSSGAKICGGERVVSAAENDGRRTERAHLGQSDLRWTTDQPLVCNEET